MALYRVEVTTRAFRWTCIVSATAPTHAAWLTNRELGGEITKIEELRNPVYVVSHTPVREEVPL